MLIPLLVGLGLTIAAVVRGAWPLAAGAWVLIGAGVWLGDNAGVFLMAGGAVLLLLGGASMTRGAIYDGSPKTVFSERHPSMFKGDNYQLDTDLDSVHFTHRFWGP